MNKNDKKFQAHKNRQAGKDFEKNILQTCDALREAGIANITKLPEPKRCIPADRQRNLYRIIHLPSPFDFYGSISNGQAIYIETKRCAQKTLRISEDDSSGGIKTHQLKHLVDMGANWGALAFLLWSNGDVVVKIDWTILDDIYQSGRKHFKVDDGVVVEYKFLRYMYNSQLHCSGVLNFLELDFI